MRRALGIFGVALLLLAPVGEHLHDHEIGHAEGDCVACQTDRTPVEPPDLAIPMAPILTATAVIFRLPTSRHTAHCPLRDAPKTSPPART